MIRTDDNAPLHSKFRHAGVAAYGWWHAALSYCGRQLTDGFIASRDLETVFPGTPPDEVLRHVDALVREGCLHRLEAGERSPCGRRRGTCPGFPARVQGVILHDYFDYQERARSARLKRRNLSTYGRQGGMKSAETRQAKASSHGSSLGSPPIRSVPIRSKKQETTGAVDNVDNSPASGLPPRSSERQHADSATARPQPTRAEQLAALAQRNGLTTDELKAQADDLARRTAQAMHAPTTRRRR